MNAKPGDKIVIIDPELSGYLDKEWVVIEEPLCGRFFGPRGTDVAWVGPESGLDWPEPGTMLFLGPHQYKVSNSAKSINDSLAGARKRMNDNLKGIFG